MAELTGSGDSSGDDCLHQILALVHTQTGLVFRPQDFGRVRQAAMQRARETGSGDLRHYCRLLRDDEGELRLLAQRLTIQETSFFRHRQQFDALRQIVLPELIAARATSRSLRLWSAGCSIGAEPYSLAMCVREVLGSALLHWDVLIWATDLDPRALHVARRAVYSGTQMRGLSEEQRKRYVVPEHDGLRLSDELRQMVTFASLNLNAPDDWGTLAPFDVIFCRNVIIYFDESTNRILVERFRRVLAQDGYLFLGHSETLWELSKQFTPVQFTQAFAYRPSDRGKPLSTGTVARRERPRSRRALSPAVHAANAVALPVLPVETAATPTKAEGAGVPASLSVMAKTAAASTPEPRTRADVQPVLAHVRELLDSGSMDAALAALEPLLAAGESAEAHLLAARILADRGRSHEAAQHCDSAVALDPLYHEAYLLGGLLALAGNNYAGANLAFERLVYLQPEDPLAHFYLGVTHQRCGRGAQSQRSYRNALNLLADRIDSEILGEMSVGALRLICRRSLERSEVAAAERATA